MSKKPSALAHWTQECTTLEDRLEAPHLSQVKRTKITDALTHARKRLLSASTARRDKLKADVKKAES